ncbi:MAG: hypothetical protein ACTSPY_10740 [Candidatus Helarchaeota archaeon]
MDLEKQILKDINDLRNDLKDLESKYELGLILEEEYKVQKKEIEEKIDELKERIKYLKKAKEKTNKKVKKINGSLDSIAEFNIQKEMELLLQNYQIEVEKSIVTIFITISVNRTEKIYLSIKDPKHIILKLSKNLLYLGDPFDYLQTLKLWRQKKPVHLVEIVHEFEDFLLDLLGMDSKSSFDLDQERSLILERARKFLKEKQLGKASYLYDYAAELSSRLGEEKVAVAYRKKVHKLQSSMKGEFIL